MRRVERYSGGLAATAFLAAAGLLQGSSTLLVAAAVPTAFVAYGALTGVRLDPDALRVERSLDRPSALPGDRVRVRVTVENEGSSLVDLRVADGVPEELPVVEGSPRRSFSLPAGGTETVEYRVLARRGTHEFGPVAVRARGISGSAVETAELDADGDAGVTCEPAIESTPLRRQTGQFTGAVGTDVGGSGVEFHSTREYRRGDPVNRVDWRRLARTGELTTVDYREHRAARVLLLVDSRRPCHVAPVPGGPTAAEMCAYGARRVLPVLLSEGHLVGTGALGLLDSTGGPALVEPDRGDDHRIRARKLLDAAREPPDRIVDGRSIPGDPPDAGSRAGGGKTGSADAGGTVPDGGTDPSEDELRTLSGRLPANTQVFLFTPALDDYPETVVRTFRALGHRVTVVSPDVTTAPETGARLLSVERDLHLESLRGGGARVVDWDRETPLAVALADALEGI